MSKIWSSSVVRLIVRDTKGGKDRVTVLPAAIIAPLREHLAKLFDRFQHQRRLRRAGRIVADGVGAQVSQAPRLNGAGSGCFRRTLVPRMRTPANRPAFISTKRSLQRAVQSGGSQGGDSAAGELPHLSPLLRDSSARGRAGHSHRAGIAGTCGCADDHDLHSCPGKGGDGRQKSLGPVDAGYSVIRRLSLYYGAPGMFFHRISASYRVQHRIFRYPLLQFL